MTRTKSGRELKPERGVTAGERARRFVRAIGLGVDKDE